MTLELWSPFPPETIRWRAQTLARDGKKALALAYIDARDGMDRLDAVCGPYRWQDSYVETAKGRVIATIAVLGPDGNWISKSDGAGDTAVEGDKGGISDAFKRAGVKWGIGRYLYDLKNVWAPCESYDTGRKDKNGNTVWAWKAWKPEASEIFTAALNRLTGNAAPAQPRANVQAPVISDTQRTELMSLCTGLGVNIGELLKAANLKDTREMPAADYDRAVKWVHAKAEAKKETA